MNTPKFTNAIMITTALGLVVPSVAVAQSETDGAIEECTVIPLEDGGVVTGATDADSLTDVLDPCDGVLVPAPVGDAELALEPPQGGETPVIEPEDVPVQ